MSKPVLDRRALLVSGFSAVALTACSDLVGPPAASPIYLLRPKTAPAGGGPRVGWQLTVVLPDAPNSLDTDRIALVQPTNQMDYYAAAAWQDRLPFAVQTALIEALEASGRFPAVGRDTEGLKSDYLLQTYVRDFQARYDVADAPPTVVVNLEAKLIAAQGRQITQTIVAHGEAQTVQNSVPVVAEAFNQALAAALAQIVEWAAHAPQPPKPA